MENEVCLIDVLPVDALTHCFLLLSSFKDLAQTSLVCRKWREAVKQSLARRDKLSFAGWRMDDCSLARLVQGAFGLKELDILLLQLLQVAMALLVPVLGSSPRTCDPSLASQCCGLKSHLGLLADVVSRAGSLQHLNIGGTFITDESLFTIARHCPQLKVVILWSCRHVTEKGLFAFIRGCAKLESINVWGMRVSLDCYMGLLAINPRLLIKPGRVNLIGLS